MILFVWTSLIIRLSYIHTSVLSIKYLNTFESYQRVFNNGMYYNKDENEWAIKINTKPSNFWLSHYVYVPDVDKKTWSEYIYHR